MPFLLHLITGVHDLVNYILTSTSKGMFHFPDNQLNYQVISKDGLIEILPILRNMANICHISLGNESKVSKEMGMWPGCARDNDSTYKLNTDWFHLSFSINQTIKGTIVLLSPTLMPSLVSYLANDMITLSVLMILTTKKSPGPQNRGKSWILWECSLP